VAHREHRHLDDLGVTVGFQLHEIKTVQDRLPLPVMTIPSDALETRREGGSRQKADHLATHAIVHHQVGRAGRGKVEFDGRGLQARLEGVRIVPERFRQTGAPQDEGLRPHREPGRVPLGR
jgi:hypothetical protein